MKKIFAKKNETRLEKHVRCWLNREATERDDGIDGVMRDLQYGGCGSGMVGHLIYTTDCIAFFKRYQTEIAGMLAEICQDCGTGPDGIFCNKNSLTWDNTDPLAQESNNQNLLAWFGFEETASRLASEAGVEV